MGDSDLIPYCDVHNWSCVACGRCCVGYRVPLKMDEYVRFSKMYGHGVVEFGLGKIYLKQGIGDRCIFQHPSQGRWVCALQAIKPIACKLFPFRVYNQPIYKRGDRSEYRFKRKTFYVYLDPGCPGIVSGKPNERFLKYIMPEIIDLGMGIRWKQKFTTSKYITWKPP